MKNLRTKLHGAETPSYRIALAGNPNSGKTSLFNALTGARQRVGNYPGVTVERRSGGFRHDGARFEVLDLPGTYSLTSFSPEERIAQEELVDGNHDVVAVVVDSMMLERSLMFVAQVMQTGANVVLCLNMADEAERAGQRIDVEKMSDQLGIPVVQTIGHRGRGVKELIHAVSSAARSPRRNTRPELGEQMETAISFIRDRLQSIGKEESGDWVALQLLVGDPLTIDRLRRRNGNAQRALDEATQQRLRIESETGHDISLFVTQQYAAFANDILRNTRLQRAKLDARSISDTVDRVVAHRVLGLPIFAVVMYAIFWVTFTLGEAPMGWIESSFDTLGGWIGGLWPAGSESALQSLLVDGVIGGVGGVLVFLPNVVLLFLGLAILEDTGYMARAAFLMDRVMHRFGLHGKSFVPMMTGFGCSIPGIMATRTLENERDRLTTMMVLPLMSCGARLPIWMLLIPAFFAPDLRAPVLFGIYATGIVLAFALALLLRKSLLRGEEAPFIMELPPYRVPTIKAVGVKMLERAWIYVRKAGTVILGISIVMWAITAYPQKDVYEVDSQPTTTSAQLTEGEITNARAAEDLRHSIAGRIGSFIEPVIKPLGFDWKMGTAMIGAFAAKEVFVSQMGIVYSMGETDEESTSLRETLRRDYSPVIGVSMILFLLISTPCMATIAVTRRESGSWRWAALQLVGLTVVAYIISLVVYQMGTVLLIGV